MDEKDEVLYLRYRRDHSSEALRILVERYKESLTLFIYGYVRNIEDAEELALDTFAEVGVASGFAGRSRFKTWLFTIGRNLAVSHVRRDRGRLLALYPDSEDRLTKAVMYETPEMEILKQERNRQLMEAMNQLPEDYRQALYLQYFEGLNVEESARVMRKSKKQVYNLTYRGKQLLKDRLEDSGFLP